MVRKLGLGGKKFAPPNLKGETTTNDEARKSADQLSASAAKYRPAEPTEVKAEELPKVQTPTKDPQPKVTADRAGGAATEKKAAEAPIKKAKVVTSSPAASEEEGGIRVNYKLLANVTQNERIGKIAKAIGKDYSYVCSALVQSVSDALRYCRDQNGWDSLYGKTRFLENVDKRGMEVIGTWIIVFNEEQIGQMKAIFDDPLGQRKNAAVLASIANAALSHALSDLEEKFDL